MQRLLSGCAWKRFIHLAQIYPLRYKCTRCTSPCSNGRHRSSCRFRRVPSSFEIRQNRRAWQHSATSAGARSIPLDFSPFHACVCAPVMGTDQMCWSGCLASLHSSTGTVMIQVDHVMNHPAHRTCTSITCAPFRSSTYVPSIRILFRVSSRCIDGILLTGAAPARQFRWKFQTAGQIHRSFQATHHSWLQVYCGTRSISHARGTKRAPNNCPDRRGAAHDASALIFCIRQLRDGGALAKRPLLWGRAEREQARHRAGGGQVAADPHGGAKSGDHNEDTRANCW